MLLQLTTLQGQEPLLLTPHHPQQFRLASHPQHLIKIYLRTCPHDIMQTYRVTPHHREHPKVDMGQI